MISTVGIDPVLSDLNTPRTSKLDFIHNKIYRYELQIPKNSEKRQRIKNGRKLNNFENFERKEKSKFTHVLKTQ